MHLLTLSLNHSTAPLALRERVAFSAERVNRTMIWASRQGLGRGPVTDPPGDKINSI